MRTGERRRVLVEQVFRRDRDVLWGYLAGMVGDGHEAEDILQEILVRALTANADFRDATAMRAYLLKSARNAAIDACRRRRPVLSQAVDLAISSDEGDDEDREAELSRLSSALGMLSDEERDALALRYDGGLTYAEIARRTSEPLGTVLARSHRALRKLARIMGHAEAG